MVEYWATIASAPDYQISTFGRVFSIRSNRVMAIQVNSVSHYCQIRLPNNGVYKNYLIHRLVADAFIDNFQNALEVNHIDSNKENNNVENLEWCSRRENQLHSFRLGIHKPNYAQNISVVQLETGEVFDSMTSAAQHYNLSPSGIANQVRGLRSHIKHMRFARIED